MPRVAWEENCHACSRELRPRRRVQKRVGERLMHLCDVCRIHHARYGKFHGDPPASKHAHRAPELCRKRRRGIGLTRLAQLTGLSRGTVQRLTRSVAPGPRKKEPA